jgi:signal transduction histidine kinase
LVAKRRIYRILTHLAILLAAWIATLARLKTSLAGTQPRRIKAAFIWPFVIVLAFILGAFLASAYFLEVRVRDQALGERVAAVSKLVEQKLDKDANLMEAVLRTMMGNRAVEEAFAKTDREALEKEVGPLFKALRDDHRITHLYFTGAALVNVLRLHSPNEFGDVIDRATTLQAQRSGQAVHGLELGPLGTLTLRLVMPWRSRDKVLGYLEIGEEIEYLVEEIRDSLSVDLFVLIDKQYLSPDQWQQGLTLLRRQGKWDRFASVVMVAQTAIDMPAALTDSALADLRGGATQVLDEGKRALHLAVLPLNDARGRRIGDLMVVRDITALQQTFSRLIMAVTILSLAAGAAVLGVYYFSLEKVERDYRRQHDLEHQLLRLGTEHQRMLQIEKLSALGTMVGEIAHQLNNPLVGVVNLAQLATREADDPARTRELLKEIHRAGADCHAFIQSMLRFSKVSSFESRPTAMSQVIEETVLLFRQTERRQFPVEVELPGHPVILVVDPILVRHALFNLLINAAQASVDEATIVIALASTPHPDSAAPGWLLTVTDHGKGIAPQLLDKIFLPFFTTRSDGTGLGLPVVQHVALLHGGYVTAASQPDTGTQFAIWLPQEPKLAPTRNPDRLGHAA